MNATPGTVTCRCGKVCKNQRGLRIHQAMSGCQRVRSRGQRIASMASEKQYWGTLRPGKKHRMPVRILKWMTTPSYNYPKPRERERAVQKQSNWHVQIDHVKPLTMNPKQRIKASDNTSWKRLDEDLDNVLEARTSGPETQNPHHSYLFRSEGNIWTWGAENV